MLPKNITTEDLARLTETKVSANLRSIQSGLAMSQSFSGLHMPHRLVLYLAQTSHETGGFTHDREIWGPTPAQKRYEGRKDLGNIFPGDGSKFRGHTGMQITGRANTTEFRDWCREQVNRDVPDFVQDPELMNTDPWEGLGPIWYWDSRNLNRYADQGDIEMVTQRINGGLNGYEDRCRRYTRIALLTLGFKPYAIKEFQASNGLKSDGIAGPRTRAALHSALVRLDDLVFVDPFAATGPAKAATPSFLAGIFALFSTLLTPKGFL